MTDLASAVAVDPAGNVYVTGGSQGYYAMLKYDPEGNLPGVISDSSALSVITTSYRSTAV